MQNASLIVLAGFFLIGCADPRIDVSSDAAMKASIAEVRDSLPGERRPVFDQALENIEYYTIHPPVPVTRASINLFRVEFTVKNIIRGRTGEQVISKAAELQARREALARQFGQKPQAESP